MPDTNPPCRASPLTLSITRLQDKKCLQSHERCEKREYFRCQAGRQMAKVSLGCKRAKHEDIQIYLYLDWFVRRKFVLSAVSASESTALVSSITFNLRSRHLCFALLSLPGPMHGCSGQCGRKSKRWTLQNCLGQSDLSIKGLQPLIRILM